MNESEQQENWECEEKKDRIRTEYQEAMENSVNFEKRIRNKWREKSKQKDEKISELEAKVEELEERLAED
jgi:hypothetical protein